MTTVKDVYDIIDRHAPFSSKESWDNCGILAGRENAEVTQIITALDITADVIREAENAGAELIVSHHPVIFTPLRSVSADSPVGMLMEKKISAVCTHTPFDMAGEGMNMGLYEILKSPLGLSENFIPLEDMGNGLSIGRIYDLNVPLSPRETAEKLKAALGCTVVRFTDTGRKISKIAVSSGAGNSFIETAAEKGAEGLVSGDIKHDSFIHAVNTGFAVFDCGHFHTERIFCTLMKNILEKELGGVEIIEAASCTDPVSYAV